MTEHNPFLCENCSLGRKCYRKDNTMTSFYTGQQIVVTENNEEFMGTIRLINSEKIAVYIDGDPYNIVHWTRPENVKSYVDIYEQTDSRNNVFVGPFANGIVKGLITKWLDETTYLGPESSTNPKNRDYPFEEEDSYSWTVREMLDIEENLR